MTVRCVRAQFRLRPDQVRVEAFGFFLGRALERCTGVRLVAATQMGNHLHLCLVDEQRELADFMCLFLGRLARAANRLDGVEGPVWGRRYSAVAVLDDAAWAERIAYTVTNPVAAGLVATPAAWPGVLLWEGGTTSRRFRWFREGAYQRAVRAQGGDARKVERADYEELATVSTSPAGLSERVVMDAVGARLERLSLERGGRPVLGRRAVLRCRVFDAPPEPKRSPEPLCHTSCPDRWRAFRDAWRELSAAYREASMRFRGGRFEVSFPADVFRPWTPILRPG